MSKAPTAVVAKARFSLGHLLTLTALIAVALGAVLSYQKGEALRQRRIILQSLSSRLQNYDVDKVEVSKLPQYSFYVNSWQVYIPDGEEFEIRLGTGKFSDFVASPNVKSVHIPSGMHRVTFETNRFGSPTMEYRIYLDGEMVLEESLVGREASGSLSNHWSNWAHDLQTTLRSPFSVPRELNSAFDRPSHDFGRGNFFNSSAEPSVWRDGYRLWIDAAHATYPPASPFINGTPNQRWEIGLANGIRLGNSLAQQPWSFSQPVLETIYPNFELDTEFYTSDGLSITRESSSSIKWELRSSATGTDPLHWDPQSSEPTRSAFLHAVPQAEDELAPIVELQWNANQPESLGIRLADSPANAKIARWGFRIAAKVEHLWRELQLSDGEILTPDSLLESDRGEDQTSVRLVAENTPQVQTVTLRWSASQSLPLQIVKRNEIQYAGLNIYQGLPVQFDVQIPVEYEPTFSVDIVAKDPTNPASLFPGGPVFGAIRSEFHAPSTEWIRINSRRKPESNTASP